MSKWPNTPAWIDPTELNNGNMYEGGDGIVVDDINAIIENLLYLKKYGTVSTSGKPIEVSTEEEINALEIGTIFVYTGETTTKFEKGAMYLVEAGE